MIRAQAPLTPQMQELVDVLLAVLRVPVSFYTAWCMLHSISPGVRVKAQMKERQILVQVTRITCLLAVSSLFLLAVSSHCLSLFTASLHYLSSYYCLLYCSHSATKLCLCLCASVCVPLSVCLCLCASVSALLLCSCSAGCGLPSNTMINCSQTQH